MPDNTHGTCAYAHPTECPALRECRRFPPQITESGPIHVTDDTFYPVASYPLVLADGPACGEHRDKPSLDGKNQEGQY